jgi:hypothetical protein
MAMKLTLGQVNPSFMATHVSPPSTLLNTPRFVPA